MTIVDRHAQGFGFALEYGDADEARPSASVPAGQPRRLSRTAVGAGIALALLCTALLAPQISAVMASDDLGSPNFFLQERRARAAPARPSLPDFGTAMSHAPAKLRAPTNLAWQPGAVKSAPRLNSAPRLKYAAASAAVSAGQRSVCVRLCDGYFFPIGDVGDNGVASDQEESCNNLCPGTPVKLYTLPAGSDQIEEAVSLRDHKPYTALPVAFRHTQGTDRTCTCHANQQANSISLLKDYTLRKGDGVMTPKGIRLFRGAQHWPYKRNDFMSLAEAQDLTGTDRGALAAIERAAKGLRPAMSKPKASAPLTKALSAPVRTERGANGHDVRIVGPEAMLSQ